MGGKEVKGVDQSQLELFICKLIGELGTCELFLSAHILGLGILRLDVVALHTLRHIVELALQLERGVELLNLGFSYIRLVGLVIKDRNRQSHANVLIKPVE